jgi:hypothetical protein
VKFRERGCLRLSYLARKRIFQTATRSTPVPIPSAVLIPPPAESKTKLAITPAKDGPPGPRLNLRASPNETYRRDSPNEAT